MTLPERDIAMTWVGLPVEDAAGGRVGTCTAMYVDEATDLPEWALVGMAGDTGTRFVPLVDARQESGALRVSFAADLIDTAPQVGDQDQLSGEEEAELYRHYGVAYSAGASDTLLPAAVTDVRAEDSEAAAPPVAVDDERDIGMDTTPPLQPEPLPVPEPVLPTPAPEPLRPSPAPPAPEPPRPSPAPPAPEPLHPSPAPAPRPGPTPPPPPTVDAKPPQRTGPPAEVVVAGLAGASAAAVLLLRERRCTTRPARRGVRSVGGALGDVAGLVTGAAQTLGSELARTSGQLSKGTADVAQTGTRAVTGAAGSGVRATKQAARKGARVVTEAAESGVRAAADVAQTGGRVVTGAADSARGVAVESRRQARRSRRQARRSWRRTAGRAVAAAGLGAGYLLGARAGERRYAQLRSTATRLGDRLRAR